MVDSVCLDLLRGGSRVGLEGLCAANRFSRLEVDNVTFE